MSLVFQEYIFDARLPRRGKDLTSDTSAGEFIGPDKSLEYEFMQRLIPAALILLASEKELERYETIA